MKLTAAEANTKILRAHSDCARIRASADAGCGRSVYRARLRLCIAVRAPTRVDARRRAHYYPVLRALGMQTYRSRRRPARVSKNRNLLDFGSACARRRAPARVDARRRASARVG